MDGGQWARSQWATGGLKGKAKSWASEVRWPLAAVGLLAPAWLPISHPTPGAHGLSLAPKLEKSGWNRDVPLLRRPGQESKTDSCDSRPLPLACHHVRPITLVPRSSFDSKILHAPSQSQLINTIINGALVHPELANIDQPEDKTPS